MKIAVFGLGYVGTAMAVLLAQRHDVNAVDISANRVTDVSAGRSPVVDPLITEFLATRDLSLRATTDAAAALPGSEFVIIATPTNYDAELDFFDTTSVEGVIRQVAVHSPASTIVIKSTIPVGFTDRLAHGQRRSRGHQVVREHLPCASVCVLQRYVLRRNPNVVGIHRLAMNSEVVRDLDEFKRRADVIVANRWSPDVADVVDKVYYSAATDDAAMGVPPSPEGGPR